ncbi:MAG TPA: hypothetical protein VFA07_02215 [Chthonomonadaceae bacterium]|nr:hypothetical protein [Chthonomonadaceae bacterium]
MAIVQTPIDKEVLMIAMWDPLMRAAIMAAGTDDRSTYVRVCLTDGYCVLVVLVVEPGMQTTLLKSETVVPDMNHALMNRRADGRFIPLLRASSEISATLTSLWRR